MAAGLPGLHQPPAMAKAMGGERERRGTIANISAGLPNTLANIAAKVTAGKMSLIDGKMSLIDGRPGRGNIGLTLGLQSFAEDDDETPLERASHQDERRTGRAKTIYEFQQFLNDNRDGTDPLLKVWFKHFDRQLDGRINKAEFCHGMKALSYQWGGVDGMWQEIDQDDSNELFFDEIDAGQARLWSAFRRWCGSLFSSAKDMIKQLKQAYATIHGPQRGRNEAALEREFVEGLPQLGWELGSESMLFTVIDMSVSGFISARDVKWLEAEVRFHQQKDLAKKRMKKISDQRAWGKQSGRIALFKFKTFLRSKYGPLFRAWRRVLDLDGTMLLQRAELFKACRQLGWQGNVRSLWKALDTDNSGYCSFEELDPHGAQLLAQFYEWAVENWGHEPAQGMFEALDVYRRKKLDYSSFATACDSYGFSKKPQTVASCFDSEDRRYVTRDDFTCLDFWRPPAWLVATTNPKAAQDFKSHLLNKYGRYVMAWRRCLDKDSTNSCNWTEFTDAARHVKFTGDVAGAWRYFDSDFSGFITLQEIDPAAFDVLMQFKKWADEEFGGIRPAFAMMDQDKSKQVSFREFRSSCRSFGFVGDVQRVYEYLSLHVKGDMLQFEEVAFLDLWDVRDDHIGGKSMEELCAEEEEEHSGGGRLLFDTRPDIPGPGAYIFRSGFGAGPSLPMAKHGGGFSFGVRNCLPSWHPPKVGPGKYDISSPEIGTPALRKPAWGFDRTPREVVPRQSRRASTPRSTPRGSFVQHAGYIP